MKVVGSILEKQGFDNSWQFWFFNIYWEFGNTTHSCSSKTINHPQHKHSHRRTHTCAHTHTQISQPIASSAQLFMWLTFSLHSVAFPGRSLLITLHKVIPPNHLTPYPLFPWLCFIFLYGGEIPLFGFWYLLAREARSLRDGNVSGPLTSLCS